jgi:hypothetical protein
MAVRGSGLAREIQKKKLSRRTVRNFPASGAAAH